MFMNPVKSFLAAAAVATTMSTAQAGPVLLTAHGIANTTSSNGIVTAGDAVDFTFLYDTALAGPDASPGANTGNFLGALLSSSINLNNGAYLFSGTGGSLLQTRTTGGINSTWRLASNQDLTDLPAGTSAVNWGFTLADSGSDADVVFTNPNIITPDIRDFMSYFNSQVGTLTMQNRSGMDDNISYTLDKVTFKDVVEEPPVNNVPEPGTVALVGLGLAALAARRRALTPV